MSWRIQLLENSVEISAKLGEKIRVAAEKHGFNEYLSIRDRKIDFNPDHQEHMDYLSNEAQWLVGILKKGKVKGRILFRDTESCIPAFYWGHEFDGEGNYYRLKGTETIKWSREGP